MIDLHCHLLDGIGCGPDTFEESLEICRLAVENDVQAIIATPRWEVDASKSHSFISECRQKLDRLRQGLVGCLSLDLGFLLKLNSDLFTLLDMHGVGLTLGDGRCLLIAISSLQKPGEASKLLAGIKERGYSVLLARPECNLRLRRDPKILNKWSEDGILLQLDAASITGAHGREVQNFSWQCLKMFPRSTVIASGVRRPSQRTVSLSEARHQLKKKHWESLSRRLLSETPARIINSEAGAPSTPNPPRPATLFTSL